MTDFETISVGLAGDCATVSLNRPEVHNAFNETVIGELTDAFTYLAANESVRAIILRGEGPSFCAGADVNWMRNSLQLSEEANIHDALCMSDMFGAIAGAPQAVIGRVHGAALGGGIGLIAVCDVVVSADGTRFGFTETRLGILPAVISRFVVPKIGPSWARRLFLTGERFDAARARDIGLVHDVVPMDALDEAIDKVVEDVRQAGPVAVREAKLLIEGLESLASDQRRAFTAATIARVRTSPEGQEGLQAFLAKRPPAWKRVSD